MSEFNIVHHDSPPEDWDERLLGHPEAGFGQTTTWARILKQVDHATPIFLEAYTGDDLTATMMTLHRVAWDRRRDRRSQGIRQFLVGDWLEWLDGPAFFVNDNETRKKTTVALLQWLHQYSRLEGIGRIIGTPSVGYRLSQQEVEESYRELGYVVSKWGSFLIDLCQDEEELWANLNRAARKSVNKARRMGLTIRKAQNEEEYVQKFLGSYQQFEAEAGREGTPPSVGRVIWAQDNDKYYNLYWAETAEGRIVATLGIYIFNGIAVEIISSMSAYAYENKLPAQDLLHWEMILAAKNNGAAYFDLAGVDPEAIDNKATGIRRFKAKWGGKYIEYPRYEKWVGFRGVLRDLRGKLFA